MSRNRVGTWSLGIVVLHCILGICSWWHWKELQFVLSNRHTWHWEGGLSSARFLNCKLATIRIGGIARLLQRFYICRLDSKQKWWHYKPCKDFLLHSQAIYRTFVVSKTVNDELDNKKNWSGCKQELCITNWAIKEDWQHCKVLERILDWSEQ